MYHHRHQPGRGQWPIPVTAEVLSVTACQPATGWRISRKAIKRYNFDPPSPWGIEQAEIWQSRGARFA